MEIVVEAIEGWLAAVKLLNHNCFINKDMKKVSYHFWSISDRLIIVYIDEHFWIEATYNDYKNSNFRRIASHRIGTEKVLEEITRWVSLL